MIWCVTEIGPYWWAVERGTVGARLTEIEAFMSAYQRPGARFPGLVRGPYDDEPEALAAAERPEDSPDAF
jgi:hypothetical protein